jgi:hypothetical protein
MCGVIVSPMIIYIIFHKYQFTKCCANTFSVIWTKVPKNFQRFYIYIYIYIYIYPNSVSLKM